MKLSKVISKLKEKGLHKSAEHVKRIVVETRTDLSSVDIFLPKPIRDNYNRLLNAILSASLKRGSWEISDLIGKDPMVSIDGLTISINKIISIAKKMFSGIKVTKLKLDRFGSLIG